MKEVQDVAKRIINNVEKVIVGKRQQLVLSLVSWFCEGHILLEDVPGVGKTLVAKALARSIDGRFTRVSDSLAGWLGESNPADVIGKADRDYFSNEYAAQTRADEISLSSFCESFAYLPP